MYFLALVSAVCLASQAFAGPLSCDNDAFEMSLAESDAAVKDYFSKLEPATKWTALHETTGPEAGADVSCFASTAPTLHRCSTIGKLTVTSFLGSSGWRDCRCHPG